MARRVKITWSESDQVDTHVFHAGCWYTFADAACAWIGKKVNAKAAKELGDPSIAIEHGGDEEHDDWEPSGYKAELHERPSGQGVDVRLS